MKTIREMLYAGLRRVERAHGALLLWHGLSLSPLRLRSGQAAEDLDSTEFIFFPQLLKQRHPHIRGPAQAFRDPGSVQTLLLACTQPDGDD